MPPSGALFERRQVFWILFLGFVASFAAALSLVVFAAPNNPLELTSTRMSNLVNVLAASVDEGGHSILAETHTTQSPDYERIAHVLRSAIGGQSCLDRVYTVRREKDGSVLRVVDVASNSNERPAMAPLDHVPAALARCLEFGLTVPSGVPIHRPDGSWLEAYSPILNSDGVVTGAVVGAQHATAGASLSEDQIKWMAVPIVIALIVSFVVAWILQANMAGKTAATHPLLQLRPLRTFLEIAVVLSVIAVLGQTVWRNTSLAEQRERRAKSVGTLRALTDSMTVLNELQHGHPVAGSKIYASVTLLQATGSGRIGNELRTISTLPAGDPGIVEGAKKAMSGIAQRQQEITETLAVATVDEQSRAQDVYQTLIVTVGVALAALVLMRLVGQQQRALAEVTQDRNEARARYARVVEGLPVGLFVIEGGALAFTNEAWKNLFGVEKAMDEIQQFYKAVHPDDLAGVISELKEAETRGKPFEIEYRILSAGRVAHVESRGTPVFDKDGMCRQLLGFTLDVSQTVEAKQAVQRTFAEVENKNRLLSAAFGELEMNLENVVRSLVRAVEAKDPYTAGHSERVKTYSLWLGERVGLSKFELRILELGTLVHDVGKIGTPDAILTKPGRLTPEEYDVIKRHPEFGVNIIESIGLFRDCLPIVRWHHEKLNGTGYPDGLSGDDIPYLVRISTIADIFDAMTSTRAYRHGMATDEVLHTMTGMMDRGELDPVLFGTFLQVIAEKGVIEQLPTRDAA